MHKALFKNCIYPSKIWLFVLQIETASQALISPLAQSCKRDIMYIKS